MRIVAISDLHGTLPEIPECDVLVIAGDVCPLDNHQVGFQKHWLLRKFYDWLGSCPAGDIVGIGGNHDFALEHLPTLGNKLPWHYLQDSGVEIDGVKFYGYPWVPNLPSWAFYAENDQLRYHAQGIPEDTDVLVTHGPPAGVGDQVSHTHVGDNSMLNVMMYRNTHPLLHVFGHIHEGRGRWDINGTTFANVSILDRNYRHVHLPMEFDIK